MADTIYSVTPDTNADVQNGQTHVEYLAVAALTLPSYAIVRVRVTLEAGSTEQLTITNIYIGHGAGTGDAYDFAATPVQMLWGGSASTTIPAGTTGVTDWAAFAYNKTSPLLVAYYFGGGTSADMIRYKTGLSNVTHYNKAANDAATVNKTGYGTSAGVITLRMVEVEGESTNFFF